MSQEPALIGDDVCLREGEAVSSVAASVIGYDSHRLTWPRQEITCPWVLHHTQFIPLCSSTYDVVVVWNIFLTRFLAVKCVECVLFKFCI